MRWLLVGPDQEENLSIRYLASALHRAGHVADLATFNTAADTDAVVAKAAGYDRVGLSLCFQSRAREFLELSRRIGALHGPRIVVGGHFATCSAETLLDAAPEIDVVVLHEGEDAIVELADGKPSEQVAGVWYRGDDGPRQSACRRSREDLDALPFPDRAGPVHLFAGVPTSYLMGSRGCVATCDYCCIVTLHRAVPGRKYRLRDPANVADEMAEQYHGRGIRQFIFHDDNFLVPRVEKNLERIEAYAAAWRARGMEDLGFTIKCRPPDADRAVFERLKALGLVRVFFGIESASEAGLDSIGRRQTVEQNERALDLAHELGISAQYTIMCFHPDATADTLRADLAFLRRHVDHALNFCRTEIYAGTPLLARMEKQGRARGDWLAKVYTIGDPAVDLASAFALRIFRERCWSTGGLMERVIGIDHLAAVLGRFYPDALVGGLRRELRDWRLDANHDLLGLLTEVVDAVLARPDPRDPVLLSQLRDIVDRERASRLRLMARGVALHRRIDEVVFPATGLTRSPTGAIGAARRPPPALARHAAAALLALSVAQACTGIGVSEYAAPPLEDSDGDGLPDACEDLVFGTDKEERDTDRDGVPDGNEDADGDGETNLAEQGQVGDFSCPEEPGAA